LTQQGSETCHQACSRKARFAAPEKKNQETIIALVIENRQQGSRRETATGEQPVEAVVNGQKKRHED
jgi:hypothetical protein